jgi:hypothetical protein
MMEMTLMADRPRFPALDVSLEKTAICVMSQTDRDGAISRAGDASVRAALFEAAHVIMTRVASWSTLKAWAMNVARRRGRQTCQGRTRPQTRRRVARDVGQGNRLPLCPPRQRLTPPYTYRIKSATRGPRRDAWAGTMVRDTPSWRSAALHLSHRIV